MYLSYSPIPLALVLILTLLGPLTRQVLVPGLYLHILHILLGVALLISFLISLLVVRLVASAAAVTAAAAAATAAATAAAAAPTATEATATEATATEATATEAAASSPSSSAIASASARVTAHACVLSVSRSVRCDRARGSELYVRTRRARRLSFGSLRLACALL